MPNRNRGRVLRFPRADSVFRQRIPDLRDSRPTARDTLVALLADFGLKPKYRIDSGGVKRALLSDDMTIVNCTDPDLYARMGKPSAAIALKVRDPWAAARKAATTLKGSGYEAEILGELDSDVPNGAMVFVKTNVLEGGMLVFRRHFLRMGKKPPKWR